MLPSGAKSGAAKAVLRQEWTGKNVTAKEMKLV